MENTSGKSAKQFFIAKLWFKHSKTALKAAKKSRLKRFCLNYCKVQWSLDMARVMMTEFIFYVDVCIGIEPL